MNAQKPDEGRVKIDWPAVIAGSGAAVTVAVLLSTLGAAGTILGAALGSSVATVATALYKQGILSSRRKMAEVQATALWKVGLAQQEVRRAAERSDSATVESDLARAEQLLGQASTKLAGNQDEAGDEPDPPSASPTRELPLVAADLAGIPGVQPEPQVESRWAALPWRSIAVGALAVFICAMVLISAFELVAGRSVSSITGGSDDKRTSITGVFEGGGDHTPAPQPSAPTATVATTPPTTAATTAPTTPATTPTAEPTTDQPTPSAEPTATETVTVTASPTQSSDAPGVPTATP